MRLVFAAILGVSAVPAAAQSFPVQAEPSAAKLFFDDGKGAGWQPFTSSKFDIKKHVRLLVRLQGYKDSVVTFTQKVNPVAKKAALVVRLNTRIVKVDVPLNATIKVNGVPRPVPAGSQQLELEVVEGQGSYTVEVYAPGWAVPAIPALSYGPNTPLTLPIVLDDRAVEVSVVPSGATIAVNGAVLGTGSATVRVPNGACVLVKGEMTGWMPTETNPPLCNKPNAGTLPLQLSLKLAGRTVNLAASPMAKVSVNGQPAGVGPQIIKINPGTCVDVKADAPGFVIATYHWCDQPNAPEPPVSETPPMVADESYPASEQSDQANVNITIEPGKDRTEEAVWNVISSIVLSHFDILENSDRETGYLRTAWQVKAYSNNAVYVRTRFIVKRANTDPLRYTVKIASEKNNAPIKSLKDDESFEAWGRILNVYKDVISEMQSRVK